MQVQLLKGKPFEVLQEVFQTQNIRIVPTQEADGTISLQGFRRNTFKEGDEQWELIESWSQAKCQALLDAGNYKGTKFSHWAVCAVGNRRFNLKLELEN